MSYPLCPHGRSTENIPCDECAQDNLKSQLSEVNREWDKTINRCNDLTGQLSELRTSLALAEQRATAAEKERDEFKEQESEMCRRLNDEASELASERDAALAELASLRQEHERPVKCSICESALTFSKDGAVCVSCDQAYRDSQLELARACNARDEARTALAASEAQAKALREALEALMRNLSNIEVLGEWEALNMNLRSRRELRPKVDAVIEQCRVALGLAEQPDEAIAAAAPDVSA